MPVLDADAQEGLPSSFPFLNTFQACRKLRTSKRQLICQASTGVRADVLRLLVLSQSLIIADTKNTGRRQVLL